MKMLAKPAQMPPGTLHYGLESALINQSPNVTSNPPQNTNPLFSHILALQHRGARNLVWRSVSLGLTLSIIDAEFDPCIIRLVGTREADRISGLRPRSRDVDLRAAHVELRTTSRASAVQCDHLSPEKILTGRNTRWNCHLRPSTIVYHSVDT